MMTVLDNNSPEALTLLLTDIKQIPDYHLYGRVTAVQGMLVEVGGVQRRLSIGDRCQIAASAGSSRSAGKSHVLSRYSTLSGLEVAVSSV